MLGIWFRSVSNIEMINLLWDGPEKEKREVSVQKSVILLMIERAFLGCRMVVLCSPLANFPLFHAAAPLPRPPLPPCSKSTVATRVPSTAAAMRSALSRLIRSTTSLSPSPHRSCGLTFGKAFSSDATPRESSGRVDEPFKVEEAEPVKVPPPSPDKLLVLGGSGFVGSHVCKEALDKGFLVSSLNRSGKPSISESWADRVTWNQGNLLEPASLKDAMDGVSAVVSCVGGFGSNSAMYKINGTANINAIRAAAEKGIKRFVYVSAADFGLVNYLLQGYYEGKRAAEAELLSKFTYGGVILRPGFIYGTRQVGRVKIPLGLVGSPMQMVLQNAKPLTRLPLVGPMLTPPVSVTSVAKVAVRAATDPVFPPSIVDVYGIMRYSDQK